MEENFSTDDMLTNAIRDAFEDLGVDSTKENVEKVKILVELERERERDRNDYYLKSSEIADREQEDDFKQQKEKEELKILNQLKAKIPDYLDTGIKIFGLLLATGIIKAYEEKGYLIRLGEIASKIANSIKF